MKWAAFWAALLALGGMGCGKGERQSTPVVLSESTGPQFVEVSIQSGIDFQHVNGASGRYYYLETYGAGAAFVDYDNDGYQDLYVVNSAPLPGFTTPQTPTNALYHNEGDGTFNDVTAAAAVGDPAYGMGVCAGDYDNDGNVDLYVTNFGPNVLYHNEGDGTFNDVTASAGVGDLRVGSSAAFADWDNDGDLDLYVANYAKFSIESNKECFQGEIQVYCDPAQYEGDSGVFYRNEADGTFIDVTGEVGGYTETGRQLGVVFGDYDNDGDVDLHVANDGMANFLFNNDGGGKFKEVGMVSGVGLNEGGRPEAGMGTDFGDYDRDGDLDIVVCNFQWESCRIFKNEGNGFFSDATSITRVGESTLSVLTFGTDFFDYDNDGDLDLYMANGHVNDNAQVFDKAVSFPQQDQLFKNEGEGTFADVTEESGPGLEWVMVSRGAAFGDYDNDGDVDIYVCNNNQQGLLLRNEGGNWQHWITLRAVGTVSNRDGIGARIRVEAGDLVQIEEVRSGSSYLSQNDIRVHFGLGEQTMVDQIEIRWPSGIEQTLEQVPADQFLVIEEPTQ
jgi:enediyne biosynthesis protein E4